MTATGLDRVLRSGVLVLLCGVGSGAAVAAGPEAHPDLSGVWTYYKEPGKPAFERSGAALDLPYTALGRAKVEEYRALVAPGSDNPGAHCLGSGMPESMLFAGVYPMEIIQRPEQITVVYEAHSEIRRLYLGAKIIPEGDRLPARNGYSTARWDGRDLLVETGFLKEQEDGSRPHSDQARISERYHLIRDPKGTSVLIATMTLTDPAFYTQPLVVEKKWALDPKGILLPYECNEEAWLDRLEELKKQRAGTAPAANR